MVSLASSFEYSATQKTPSFRVELFMLLFCLAGILLFVGGIVVGKQLTMAGCPQEEPAIMAKTTVAHGKFGAPRYQHVPPSPQQWDAAGGTDQLLAATRTSVDGTKCDGADGVQIVQAVLKR